MSLAYLDPGNLESSLQLGAYTRFSLVWVLWWSTVMGLILQEMSARLGLATGLDLAQCVRQYYPRWLNYVVYVMMEIAVIGADIQEVVGSGVALNLLTNGALPVWAGCLITGLDTFTFLAVQYLGVRYLEALICLLIGTMSICFFINWGTSGADAGELIHGWIVPAMPAYALTQTVGTIGAVIMPHNLYLHSGLVLSRKVPRARPQKVYAAIWYARIEAAGALLFAFFINLAVIATNASTFFQDTCTDLLQGPFACMGERAFNRSGDNKDINLTISGQGTPCLRPNQAQGQCGEIGLSSEGYALEDAFGKSGEAALVAWGLGLLAAGQASTMVCTYAGQLIMGGCLQFQLKPWKRVALTRVFALGPALAVAVFSEAGGASLFNNINEYLNVLQSVQLPFAMLPVLHFASSPRIMGRFVSGRALFAISCSLALVVMSINVLLIVQFIEAPPSVSATGGQSGRAPAGVIAAVCLVGVGYFYTCFCLMREELTAVATYASLLVLPRGHAIMRSSQLLTESERSPRPVGGVGGGESAILANGPASASCADSSIAAAASKPSDRLSSDTAPVSEAPPSPVPEAAVGELALDLGDDAQPVERDASDRPLG